VTRSVPETKENARDRTEPAALRQHARGRRLPILRIADGYAVNRRDELLVARLAADLSGAERVDLSLCDTQGVERHRMDDIPVRRDAGRVVLQESISFAKASPSMTMVVRLLAVGADGGERLLGEYTFQHTRTTPGPPGLEW